MRSKSSTAPATTPADIFATTHWTVVLAAGKGSPPEAARALESLCQIYWYPLYAYVRRQGYSKEDAEDLTQGFFARFLARNYLEDVRSDKGRFRAFLLASLKHYLANEFHRSHRLKRGGGLAPLSLDWRDAEARYGVEPADAASPDKLYDRAWALLLLERVIAALGEESASQGKTALFAALKPFLMVDQDGVPYSQIATQLQLNEGAVRVAVHRLRRRYRALLRKEIAQTLSDPSQVEAELGALFSAFS
ncbi:MAG TPA: sigma factor-like helix-turn-helix DNA-binding protein [Clostridia bacterium]|nr:sigma factor-like helix-turn-helix DNA-binding protein [Clostridia bacterium]